MHNSGIYTLKGDTNDIKLVFEINTRLQTNISIKKSILKNGI